MEDHMAGKAAGKNLGAKEFEVWSSKGHLLPRYHQNRTTQPNLAPTKERVCIEYELGPSVR